MHGHRGNVTDVNWSPDGQLLASASLDNTVCVWNTAGNRVAILTGVCVCGPRFSCGRFAG